MSKCELFLELLQIASISQITHSPMQGEKLQFSPLLAAILDFCGKLKSVNILKTVTDTAILSGFLTHRVVQDCPMQRGKISIFATSGNHLGFLQKMKKVNISKTVRDRAISSEFSTHRVIKQCPMQRGKLSI